MGHLKEPPGWEWCCEKHHNGCYLIDTKAPYRRVAATLEDAWLLAVTHPEPPRELRPVMMFERVLVLVHELANRVENVDFFVEERRDDSWGLVPPADATKQQIAQLISDIVRRLQSQLDSPVEESRTEEEP